MSSRSVNIKSGWYYNAETPGWGFLVTQIGEFRYNVMLFYRNYEGRSVWLMGEHNFEESLSADLVSLGATPQLPGMVSSTSAHTRGSITIDDIVNDETMIVRIELRGDAVSGMRGPQFSPPPPSTHEWRGQVTRLV